jgi:type VI secretion system secreted protein VgrG
MSQSMSEPNLVTVGARLQLGGAPVHVASAHLVEALSQVSHATVEVATTEALDPAALKGGSATLELLLDEVPVRRFSLVVGKVRFAGDKLGSQRFLLQLYSPFWLLRHTRALRKFRNMSAKDIVSQVLGESGVAHAWLLRREPPARKFCVQYRESRHDFVSRLLEFEGIYTRTEADGSLSLEDESASVDPVDGVTGFALLEHAGSLEGGDMGVHGWGWGARVGVGTVTLNDFNWKTPDVSLLQTQAASRDAELERYDYPAGFRKPGQGAELAQLRLEAERARTRFAEGVSNVVHFMPGRKATIEGNEVVFIEVEHHYHDPNYFEREQDADDAPDEQEPLYDNRFEAIPADVPFRPKLETAQPSIDGCHTVLSVGPVGEEIHTDRYGRFRAKFHWDREATSTDEDSRWLRKLQEGATSINLARVGWEVSVAYLDGDPDRPIGLARDINGAMVPAYGQPANKPVMTLKTPTYPGKVGYNELKLDDSSGAQRFDWRAEKDWINRVNNDKTETVGNDETHVVDAQFKHYVKRDQQLNVGGNQTTTVESNYNLAVGDNRSETVGGNQNIDVGASFQVGVEGDQSETVGSVRLSIVGSIKPPDIAANAKAMVPGASSAQTVGEAAVAGAGGGGGVAGAAAGAKGSLQSMVPTPQGAASQLTGGLSGGDLTALASGAIDRGATERLSRTVGAIHLAAAGDNINVGAQYLHAEAIGGAKITIAKDGIAQSGGKATAITVGGALFKKSGGDAGYNATLTKVTVGGLTKFDGGETFELTGKTIQLVARTSLELASGDLRIKLEPAKTSIEGTMRMEATEKVVVTGKDDNLTGGG